MDDTKVMSCFQCPVSLLITLFYIVLSCFFNIAAYRTVTFFIEDSSDVLQLDSGAKTARTAL